MNIITRCRPEDTILVSFDDTNNTRHFENCEKSIDSHHWSLFCCMLPDHSPSASGFSSWYFFYCVQKSNILVLDSDDLTKQRMREQVTEQVRGMTFSAKNTDYDALFVFENVARSEEKIIIENDALSIWYYYVPTLHFPIHSTLAKKYANNLINVVKNPPRCRSPHPFDL